MNDKIDIDGYDELMLFKTDTSTLEEAESIIIKAFLKDYPTLTRVVTLKQLLLLVNINLEIRSWYLNYKSYFATSSSKPEFLTNSPFDLESWAKLDDERVKLTNAEKEWNKIVKSASDQMRIAVRKVESEKKTYYSKLDPLLIISKVTVNQLPIDDTVDIVMCTTEVERKKVTKEKVLKKQRELYKDYKDGNFSSPF